MALVLPLDRGVDADAGLERRRAAVGAWGRSLTDGVDRRYRPAISPVNARRCRNRDRAVPVCLDEALRGERRVGGGVWQDRGCDNEGLTVTRQLHEANFWSR